MRIAILGANGQIGRHVFEKICDEFPGAEVLACVRHKHLHFEGCTGDKRQHSFVFYPFTDDWRKLGKVDVLVNCIGIIRESGELTFEKAHIGLTRLMIGKREMLGMPRVIQLSVLGADKSSASRFMSTKAAADDELARESDTYVVRPSIVCSHNTMMVRKLRMIGKIARWMFNSLPFPAPFLETRIQPVMVEDLAQIISRIARNGSTEQIINVTGPEEISLRSLIETLNNGKIKIVPVSKGFFDAIFPVLRVFAPRLLSWEQMILLSNNNTADNTVCARLLGRPMSSTRAFWKEELSVAPAKPVKVCL
jgi:nucleoside-diphosphate-sugar epimerase